MLYSGQSLDIACWAGARTNPRPSYLGLNCNGRANHVVATRETGVIFTFPRVPGVVKFPLTDAPCNFQSGKDTHTCICSSSDVEEAGAVPPYFPASDLLLVDFFLFFL